MYIYRIELGLAALTQIVTGGGSVAFLGRCRSGGRSVAGGVQWLLAALRLRDAHWRSEQVEKCPQFCGMNNSQLLYWRHDCHSQRRWFWALTCLNLDLRPRTLCLMSRFGPRLLGNARFFCVRTMIDNDDSNALALISHGMQRQLLLLCQSFPFPDALYGNKRTASDG